MKTRTIIWFVEDIPTSAQIQQKNLEEAFFATKATRGDDDWRPLVRLVSEGEATLAAAYDSIQALTVDTFPDIVICDVRLDGRTGADVHKQIYQITGAPRTRLNGLVASIVQDVCECYSDAASTNGDAGLRKEQGMTRARDAERAMLGEAGSGRADFLGHGGWYAALWIRRRAAALGVSAPEIIFFSGSPTATENMLPAVVGEGQIIVDKGDRSLSIFQSLIETSLAKRFRRAVSGARNPLLNAELSNMLASIDGIMRSVDRAERQDLIAGLTPLLTKPLAGLDRSLSSYRCDLMRKLGMDTEQTEVVGDEQGLQLLLNELKHNLDSVGKRLVYALNAMPCKGLLHPDNSTKEWGGAELLAAALC
ncbi:MAG: hypothetical protein WCN95_07980, partial [bacterium]